MRLRAKGLVALLGEANFQLRYLWSSRDVLEAIASAMRQSVPPSLDYRNMRGKIESILESDVNVFGKTLDFSCAIYFHAVKPGAPTNQPPAYSSTPDETRIGYAKEPLVDTVINGSGTAVKHIG
jgi:hypothetical protein